MQMSVGFNTVNPLVEVVTEAATISQPMETASRKYANAMTIATLPFLPFFLRFPP